MSHPFPPSPDFTPRRFFLDSSAPEGLQQIHWPSQPGFRASALSFSVSMDLTSLLYSFSPIIFNYTSTFSLGGKKPSKHYTRIVLKYTLAITHNPSPLPLPKGQQFGMYPGSLPAFFFFFKKMCRVFISTKSIPYCTYPESFSLNVLETF